MKKYELTANFKIDASGIKMYQIKALKDFGDVKKGDLGGYIEREENLSQDGNSWVAGSALVSGSAKVSGSALICGSVLISGSAKILGNARISWCAKICNNADYAIIQGFGREFRNTTFFRCNDGEVRVSCGCFFGTIDQFRQQVRTTRDGKIAQEYLKIADLMELHFE